MFPSDAYDIGDKWGSSEKPSYRNEGFLAIQNAIAKTLITRNDASISIPEIQVQRFPKPSNSRIGITKYLPWVLPLFLLISINYTFMNTIRFIVMEKEKQLKETMRIMGLANWMHYLTWFIRTIILLFISFLVITILLKVSVQSFIVPKQIPFLSHFLWSHFRLHVSVRRQPFFQNQTSYCCSSYSSDIRSV